MSKSFDPLSSLNVGIGKIIGQDAVAQTSRLPDSAPFYPLERPPQFQERHLWSPSLENALHSSLQPRIEHRNVLLPNEFHELISDAVQALENLPDAESSQEMREAVALLREDRENKELLALYRNALHKG